MEEKKKIIEYNGDYWHCNPNIYCKNFYHGVVKRKASEIWKLNKQKINFAKQLNYEVLVVWELDWIKNRGKTIERIFDFLNERKNNEN